jgi:hypothetical protein
MVKLPIEVFVFFKKKQSGSQGKSTTMWWVGTVYGNDNFLPKQKLFAAEVE